MAVIARPDLIGALIARLRAVTEVTALTSTRISAALQDAWNMPTHAVLLRAVGGPPGDRQANILVTRLDVFCYGSTPLEAMRLWRLVDPALSPDQSVVSSFTQTVGGVRCRVYDIVPERLASSDVEPDTGWPRVSATYLVRWSGAPA